MARASYRSSLAILAAALVTAGLACDEEGSGNGDDAGNGGNDATADTAGGADLGGPQGTLPEMASLIDLDALYRTNNLAFTLEDDRSGLVPGDFDEPVWQIGVRYDSISFAGEVWSHSATLILPDTLPAGQTAAAIIPRSTPNPVEEVSDSVAYLTQFAALTADRLDIPVLVVDVVPSSVDLRGDPTLSAFSSELSRCFAGAISDDAVLTDCLWELSQLADDPAYFPGVPVGASWVRAVTMLQYLVSLVPSFDLTFEPPAFRADDVVVLGGGLSALGARYGMAMDHRIAGVMAAGADIGTFSSFFELMDASWSANFSYGTPSEQVSFWDGSSGAAFADLFDWPALRQAIGGRAYLAAVGSNDPRAPLGAHALYAGALPTDNSLLYVTGYGAGFGTLDHLLTWRAFAAHVIEGRDLPTVSADVANNGGNLVVTATVAGDTRINSVSAVYVQRQDSTDDRDLRDALWRTTPMTETSPGVYSGAIAPLVDNSAVFVRVSDSEGLFEGVVTSPVVRIP